MQLSLPEGGHLRQIPLRYLTKMASVDNVTPHEESECHDLIHYEHRYQNTVSV